MKKNRRHISQGKRDEILGQTSGACFYCGYYADTLDHIVPHSYIANDSESNLVPACALCNSIAYNKHFDSLQAKKEYILKERGSLKWRRRISAMTVTVIQPATHQEMPKEPTSPGPSKPSKPSRLPKPAKETKRKPMTRLKPPNRQTLIEKADAWDVDRSEELLRALKEKYIDDDSDEENEQEAYVDALGDDEFDELLAACEKRKQEDEEEERWRKLCLGLTFMVWRTNATRGHLETEPPTVVLVCRVSDTDLIPTS